MSPGSFHRDLRASLRERALDVAARVTAGKGWSAVRMTAIADEVGVLHVALEACFLEAVFKQCTRENPVF